MSEVPLYRRREEECSALRARLALFDPSSFTGHRGTSLIRNTPLLGLYSRTMSIAIWRP